LSHSIDDQFQDTEVPLEQAAPILQSSLARRDLQLRIPVLMSKQGKEKPHDAFSDKEIRVA